MDGRTRREHTDGLHFALCCTFNRIDNWTFALRMLSIFPSHRRQKMEMEKKHLFSCLAHRLCDVTQSTDECIRMAWSCT